MHQTERTIVNAITGEGITFVKSCHETDGEYLLIKVDLPAGGEGPPMHYHESFEEAFEVLEGELAVTVDGQEMTFQAGDQVVVATGMHHRFRNASDQPVSFYVTLTPGHYFEESMRIAYGLIRDGRINKKGLAKNILHTALILQMQDSYIVDIPRPVQTVVFGTLAKIAVWFGVKKTLEERYLPNYLRTL